MTTNLIVRNLDADIVKSLKEQAARHGRSAEAEHRASLEALDEAPAQTSPQRGSSLDAQRWP